MEKTLRKLARSYKYQSLYARAKELGHIKLFENNYDFTKIQILFLRWLEIYYILYTDLASKENYISEEVIKDDIRAEAYLLYKNTKKDEKEDKNKRQVDTTGQIPSVIFRRQ